MDGSRVPHRGRRFPRVHHGRRQGQLLLRGDHRQDAATRRAAPGDPLKLVVAVGGASGAIYAKRLLDVVAALRARDPKALEVGLCFSPAGVEVYEHEVGPIPDYPFPRYETRDFRAPFASGSAGWDAMVVIPCSIGGLARIAHGLSEDLIGRA